MGTAGAGVSSMLAFLRSEAGGAPETTGVEPYEFLQLRLGDIRGYSIFPHLYTIPASASEKMYQTILSDADAVFFVVDSQEQKQIETQRAFGKLYEKLKELDILDAVIAVLLNKRDLPDAVSVAKLKESLKLENGLIFEAVTQRGFGVMQAFKDTLKVLLKRLT